MLVVGRSTRGTAATEPDTAATMFFDGWGAVLRTLAVGAASYVALVAILRVSGKRTLSKWNAFDFVVTVALGSSLATALLSEQTTFAQAAAGFALLVVLQLSVTWLSVRVRAIERFVKARPAYLVWQGRPCDATLRRERVTLAEVRTALRSRGLTRIEDVGAVVLETDGSFSVIESLPDGEASALADVPRAQG
jgi:uncharacterized membrane protein YcaP (DUF421 family)